MGKPPSLRGGDPQPGAAPFQPAELPLTARDTRLPWLEPDDEESDESRGLGPMLGLVALVLVVLGLVAAAVWYVTREPHSAALVADGGVIRAPGEPYKQRPGDRGGKIAQGTGDMSFIVAEGKSRSVHVATAPDDAGPEPSAAPVAGVAVQLGAFSTASEAESAWPKLSQRYPALSTLHHRVVESRADIGSVFGLQAISSDAATARALCGELRTAGLNCRVRG